MTSLPDQPGFIEKGVQPDVVPGRSEHPHRLLKFVAGRKTSKYSSPVSKPMTRKKRSASAVVREPLGKKIKPDHADHDDALSGSEDIDDPLAINI